MTSIFRSFVRGAVILSCILSVVFSLFTPVSAHASPVFAQTSNNVSSNFLACDVATLKPGTDQKGLADFFSGCMRSVLTFIVVIALLALVIRIVVLSIGNTTPGANSDGIVEIRKAISDTVIGILFLGGAALFLTPLNPLFNNVNIFDLPGLNGSSSVNSSSTPSYSTAKITEAGVSIDKRIVELSNATSVADKAAIIDSINYIYSSNCGIETFPNFPTFFTDEMKASCTQLRNKVDSGINGSGVKPSFLPANGSVVVPQGWSAKVIGKNVKTGDTGVTGDADVEFTSSDGSQKTLAKYSFSYSSMNFEEATNDLNTQLSKSSYNSGEFVFKGLGTLSGYAKLENIN